jgi:hypothetical protein
MAEEDDRAGDAGAIERLLTVARVRTQPMHAEVTFFETARIYRLPADNPTYAEAVRLLSAAARDGTAVRVRFAEPHGAIIEAVRIATQP